MQASIIQLTDCHLGETSYRGVDPWRSLRALVAQIRREEPPADVLLVTGDIAEDGLPATYEAFLAGVAGLGERIAWVPGNHDDPVVMQALRSRGAVAGKRLQLGNWELLLLDSRLEGAVHGELSAVELSWLRETLAASTAEHLLLVLHHHVAAVGTRWMDALRLANAPALWQCLAGCPRVRGIVCGHVHQEVDIWTNGVRLLGTPATSVQFSPGSERFALDDKPPGYRRLRLREDGAIDTAVERLAAG